MSRVLGMGGSVTCPSHGSFEGRYFFPDFFSDFFFRRPFFISRPMLDFPCPAGRAGGSLYRAPTAAPLLAGCSGCFGPFRAKTAILGQNGTFDVENDRRDLASARTRFSFQPTLFVLPPLPPTHRENRSKRRLYSAPRFRPTLTLLLPRFLGTFKRVSEIAAP